MFENCRQYCPLVDLCSERHAGLMESKRELERSTEMASDSLTKYIEAYTLSDAAITIEEVSIRLITEGALPPITDSTLAIDKSLEQINQHRRRGSHHEANIDFLVTLLDHYREDGRQNAADIARSAHTIDQLQTTCRGPRLTTTGRLHLAGAVVKNWLQIDPLDSPDTQPQYLLQNGYARCTSPLARTVMSQLLEPRSD